MDYRSFTIVTFISNNIQKSNKQYNGFSCFVYSKYDTACITPIDCFDIAVGIEIKGIDYYELESFIKKYVDENINELKEIESSYFCISN